MAIYGIDYYGRSFYGAAILVDYAVGNLTALQLGFGHVRIAWTAPAQNTWTGLALVRSEYGFPATVEDGQLLDTFSSTQASTTYDDIGLTPGYWYYGLFAAVPLAAWSAELTYQAGDRVSYSAQNWIALQIAPAGTTPAAGAYWAVTEESAIWQPAGAIATLSVADHGYAGLMSGYIPPAYKAAPVLSTDNQASNDDLAAFVDVLAWGFELVGTEIDDLYHLYDTSTTRYDRLQLISQMVGVSVEGAASPRYQRLRTAKAAALGREKGTAAGLVDLIEAATGLACTVSTGANRMLNRDQSDFPYPLYPAWETDEAYTAGDLVTYQGSRYVCIPWSLTLPTGDYAGSPGSNASGTTSGLAWTGILSATGPTQLTGTFTVPLAGVYMIEFTVLESPNNAVVSVSVDGQSQSFVAASNLALYNATASSWTVPPSGDLLTTVDTYNAGSTTATYGFPVSLPAGLNTIKFTGATKDVSSGGFNIQVSTTVSAVWDTYLPNATPPANGATGSGAQWQAPPAAPQSVYANAQTGQASTYTSSSSIGLGVEYLGAAGLSMDASWLAVTSGMTSSSVYRLTSAAQAKISTFTGGTYPPGSIVTGPDGLQYTALTTTSATPPSPGNWARSGYQSPSDRELIGQSCTPIHPAPAYDQRSAYTGGSMVQYGNCLFVTPSGASGITPPASPGNNAGWEYAGPAAALAMTSSFYLPNPQTGYDTVYPGIAYYDQSGQPVVTASEMSTSGTTVSGTGLPVLARLIEPVGEIDGTYPDAGPNALGAIPTGIWQVSSGAAAVSPSYTGTTKFKLVYTDTAMANCRVGLTFVTDVANPAVRDTGLVFRMADASNFYVATRDKLVLVSGGTPSTLATYTRLPVGSRIFVDLNGSTIALYTYPGASASPTLVTTVTSLALETSTQHGLIDWTK